MTFDNSIKTCLKKSFTFKGRASRSEYWYFYLFFCLIAAVEMLLFITTDMESNFAKIIIAGIVVTCICCICPGISVTVRRFHDINKSGWNFWWSLIPYIGSLVVLYFMVQPSSDGKNKYDL